METGSGIGDLPIRALRVSVRIKMPAPTMAAMITRLASGIGLGPQSEWS